LNLKGNAMQSNEIDQLDRRILHALQIDARVSHAELGRRIGLSAAATGERVKRLEAAQVITGAHAQVNPGALGLGITAFVTFISDKECSRVPGLVQAFPEVIECYRLTGEVSALLKVVVRDVSHLENLIDRLTQIGKTNTSIVLSTAFANRPFAQVGE
jgi:Lrp/AsnC family transcriptional regulator, leucine-responsive regulatory protein